VAVTGPSLTYARGRNAGRPQKLTLKPDRRIPCAKAESVQFGCR
jgi:hypothetical protein